MKFSTSLIQLYKTKLCGIVHSTDYFSPFILKFKTFIYNSNNKIICNLCLCGNPSRRGWSISAPTRKNFFNIGIFRERIKIRKTDCELVYDSLNQINQFFSFLRKKNLEMSFRSVIENHQQDNKKSLFLCIYDYTLLILKSSTLFLKVSCHNLYIVHVLQMEGALLYWFFNFL